MESFMYGALASFIHQARKEHVCQGRNSTSPQFNPKTEKRIHQNKAAVISWKTEQIDDHGAIAEPSQLDVVGSKCRHPLSKSQLQQLGSS
ncbi:hypothetical protein ACLOJK_037439 [Asimina triloba]